MSEPTTAGAVTGRVHSPDGWPVSDAVITLTDARGVQVGRVTVGADGSFSTDPLPSGTYIAIVSSGGYQPLARTVQVAHARATTLGALTLTRSGGLDLPEPGVWEIDPAHSTVRATALHLGLGRVHGRFGTFSGRVEVGDPPENTRVSVTIDAASIDTGNAQRDKHLRSSDFLDAGRWPTLRFVNSSVRRISPEQWLMTGPLTMRDVTRPVELDVTYLGTMPDLWGGVRVGFTASTQLGRDDFAMTWNQSVIAGITAFGRTLKIEIDIQAVRQT
jgi:polyisoprenoid-binding protein YceI